MRSLRLALNLWYIGILAAVLCLFSGLLYLKISSSLARDVDRTLTLRADGIANTIFAFWRAERAATGAGPGNWVAAPSPTFARDIERGELPALLSRWAQKTGGLAIEHAIRLLDQQGRTLGASSSFSALAPLMADAGLAEAKHGHASYQTLHLPDRRLRWITRPVVSGRRILYFVQCAASLEDMDASLARLRTSFFVLIPLMLLGASTMGLLLASQALGPIRRLIAQAQQFTSESLHEQMTVPSSSNEVEQLGATFNDMLMRIDRAVRRLRQFSAAASHELRTPLTAMRGEIEVALRRPRRPEEYEEVLQTQLELVDDMSQTVEEMLRLAQAEALEGKRQWQPVELKRLAEQVARSFKRLAQQSKARIEIAAQPPVWVNGESRLLERLLANLLGNAIRYAPPKSTIQIAVEAQAQEARLTVHDDGPGIPAEQLPHVFDQFFRRRPTGDGARSTGLGLGLCRWIAEFHFGRLEVASAPEQGTTVSVWLPLAPSSA